MSAAADSFGPMQHVVLDNVRQGSLLAAVGSTTYSRGATYAREQAVTDMGSEQCAHTRWHFARRNV